MYSTEIGDPLISTLHADVDAGGSGGALSSRPAAADWWEAPRRAFALRERRAKDPEQVDYGLWFEWPGETRHDHAAEPNPTPPPWVDVIAPGEDGALVRVRLRLDGDEVRRVAVEIAADNLSSRQVARLAPDRFLERLEASLADFTVSRILGEPWRREIKRPGRRGRPLLDYAIWALRYVQACEARPKAPVPLIVESEAAAGRHRTVAEVRGFVNRARERELLTSPPPGLAGGDLTAKARRLLRGAGFEINEGGSK